MSGNYKRILDHLTDDEFTKILEACGCDTDPLATGGGSSEVLMQNLAKIHEYAGEMLAMCKSLGEVEDWVEDKISKASQSLSDVKHYIEYKTSAYAVQQNGSMAHQPDAGERMPVMKQRPVMTPPAAPQPAAALPPASPGMPVQVAAADAGEPEEEEIGLSLKMAFGEYGDEEEDPNDDHWY